MSHADDSLFPEALKLELEAHFKSRTPAVQCEFVDYPGKHIHRFPMRHPNNSRRHRSRIRNQTCERTAVVRGGTGESFRTDREMVPENLVALAPCPV